MFKVFWRLTRSLFSMVLVKLIQIRQLLLVQKQSRDVTLFLRLDQKYLVSIFLVLSHNLWWHRMISLICVNCLNHLQLWVVPFFQSVVSLNWMVLKILTLNLTVVVSKLMLIKKHQSQESTHQVMLTELRCLLTRLTVWVKLPLKMLCVAMSVRLTLTTHQQLSTLTQK